MIGGWLLFRVATRIQFLFFPSFLATTRNPEGTGECQGQLASYKMTAVRFRSDAIRFSRSPPNLNGGLPNLNRSCPNLDDGSPNPNGGCLTTGGGAISLVCAFYNHSKSPLDHPKTHKALYWRGFLRFRGL